MSISVDDMRLLVSKAYKGPKWKYKVQNMTDRQVIALYFSFCEKGKFDKKPEKPVQPKHIEVKPVEDYSADQMWMDFIFD